MAIRVERTDEGCGAFLRITNSDIFKDGALRIEYEELLVVVESEKLLIGENKE